MLFQFGLLSQICKSRIIYHNNLITITLIKNEKIIAEAKKEQNLFIFDLMDSRIIMTIISLSNNTKDYAIVMTRQGRPISLVN